MSIDIEDLPQERDIPTRNRSTRRTHLLQELAATSATHSRFSGQRWPTAAAAVAIVATAVLATPAFGLGSRLLGLFNGNPSAPSVDVGQSQKLLAVHVGADKQAILWHAPTADGGTCTFVQVAALSNGSSAVANAGALCGSSNGRPAAAPIQTFVTWVNTGDTTVALVHGQTSHTISQVRLESPSGAAVLPSSSGYFLGALPGSAASPGQLPSGGPFSVAGYGANDQLVARVDLSKLIADSTP